MKIIKIDEVDVRRGIAEIDAKHGKLEVGMVFEISGCDNINGTYIVTAMKRSSCDSCPFGVQSSFAKHIYKKCGLLKRSRSGYIYPFCAKDLRGRAMGSNAFTINRLDEVLEVL